MSDQPPRKEPHGHLRFSLQPPRGAQLDGSNIPVEIRKPSLALATRCLSSDVVELEPGAYVVTAQLPSGQVLSGSITLSAGTKGTVQLEPEEDAPLPPPVPGGPQLLSKWPTYLERTGLIIFSLLTHNTTSSGIGSRGLLRCLVPATRQTSRNPRLRGAAWRLYKTRSPKWVASRFDSPSSRDGQLELRVAEDQPTVVQLLRPRAAPSNIVLPIPGESGHPGCRIIVERGPTGAFQVDIRLDNAHADALLRYSQAGDRNRALLSQREVEATKLLYDKMKDPVGAAIGAYALLRFKQARDIPEWTRNLCEWFPHFPDGAVIWAEHLARRGEHGQALRVLMKLEQRGLPLFSAGLSHAVDRLSAYTQVHDDAWPRDEAPTLEERSKCETLLAALSRYAACTDFSRPVTTYHGARPFAPGEKPGPEVLVPDPTDVDLTSYFPE
ncbi:hypothetical protein [Pyxidicoccus sp. MSG2]|uniref:hypothetical protein n=1 Tax=Pyxidicoccus sp. MSG2 TaxID=2996790 RepID=UPI00226EC300|nr:hypothetical protein [Pyxidicoccus sp. MSG2]MCY1021360.1 hypothetical protein [Pyxidicoccus sp. MSG2]